MPDSPRSRAEARFITTRTNQRALTQLDREAIGAVEAYTLALAEQIETSVKDGRLKSLALTNLEQALTWANKSLYTEGVLLSSGEGTTTTDIQGQHEVEKADAELKPDHSDWTTVTSDIRYVSNATGIEVTLVEESTFSVRLCTSLGRLTTISKTYLHEAYTKVRG